MIKVVFVGDEPSRLNRNIDIAFVGAKCFPTLVDWIKQLSIDYYVCINSNKPSDIDKIHCLAKNGFKIVALGNKASKRLKNLVHYKLPHPSGLNRKLNNKQELALYLLNCNDYLLGLD
jgi:hypothetical protein